MHIALKWVTFAVAAALFLAFMKYGFGPLTAQHPNALTLDGKKFYRPSQVSGLLEALGAFRPAYRQQEMTIDLMFPLVYGLMFVSAIVGLTPGARTPWWLVVVPIFAVGFDYVENFTAIALLGRYPGDLGVLPYVASVASAVKSVAFGGSAIISLLLAVLWVVRR